MKKGILISALCWLAVAIGSAQVQQGVVKTIGRPNSSGQPLQGVTIRIREVHNAVVSGTGGSFTVSMPGKKQGEPYTIQSVRKNGYEPCESDIIGRQYGYSSLVPLTIKMVDQKQLEEDRLRIEDRAYRVAERNYKARLAELEQKLRESKISADTQKEQVEQLKRSFENYQLLIDGMADHYARIDYDELDEENRRISMLIEAGELEQADSMIRRLFNPVDLLSRHQEIQQRINQQLALAEEIQQKAREDLERLLKQQARDAEHLYQLYTIRRAQGSPYSPSDRKDVTFYLTTRAKLDTTNVEWQTAVGREDWIDKDVRLRYLLRAQSLALTNYGEHSLQMADIYEGLGNCCLDERETIVNTYGRKPELRDSLTDATVQKAYNYHQKALAIRRSLLGETHVDVGRNYERLGYCFEVRPKEYNDPTYITEDSAYTAAIHYYSKAVEILESSQKKTDLHLVADICHRISFRAHLLLDLKTALHYKEKEIGFLITLHGETHKQVARGYVEAAQLYSEKPSSVTMPHHTKRENKVEPDYRKALEYNQKALAVYQALAAIDMERLEKRGSSDWFFKDDIYFNQRWIGNCYSIIGDNYCELGDYAKALTYYKMYIDHATMLQKTDTITHSNYAFDIKRGHDKIKWAGESVTKSLAMAYEELHIARLYAEYGKSEAALHNYKVALRAEKEALGEDAPSIVISAESMDAAFGALNEGIQRLQDIQKNIFYQKPFCLTKACINIGDHIQNRVNYYEDGFYEKKLPEALSYYMKAHDLIVDSLGEHHLVNAANYERMGAACLKMKDYAKSISYYTKAIAIRTDLQSQNDTIAYDLQMVNEAQDMIVISQYLQALSDGTLADFLSGHCFTATIAEGDCPARQQGMDGEYILLKFADWTPASPVSLYDRNQELRGQPKDIIVMKNGVVSHHHFDNSIGAKLGIRSVTPEEKRLINQAVVQ